jgi:pyruvate dehydrogenase E2 component (dihydrolipoamide acetyltransferase)
LTNPLTEIAVPDIGNYHDVEVIDVAVKPGDSIALEGTLITLETEKATMDVPSTVAGIVREVKLQRGSRVSQGDVIALVEAEGTAAAATPGAAKPPPQPAANTPSDASATAPRAATPQRAEPAAFAARDAAPPRKAETPAVAFPADAGRVANTGVFDEPGFARAHASPSIRKLARELGVDLGRVSGTGAKGRVTEIDVKGFVKKALSTGGTGGAGVSGGLPPVPSVDFAAFGPIERKPLNRIQKISGPRLHASWVNLPHVTQFDEADITAMEETRQAMKEEAAGRGIKLTPLAFIMRACVQALARFPQFCASLDAEAGELVYKKYVHVGFAADTPQGLLVPVVRDADRKDVFELARELATLSEKARAGKLTAGDMQGGCFTISSLGGIGGTAFTPIINAPEVAILGVSRSAQKPVYKEGGFVPRLMVPLSLSYDHRVIDGATAVRFTTFLAEALADVPGLTRAIP